MAAVAVKANATIVHEDIPLVPATPLSPRETLNNQPSWEAIKALVERHPGWRASLREASPVEQERGLVFSVDVFFSVTAQAYRDTAASSVISGVSAESGIETACSGAEAASRAIPHGVKAFATRQKKRHNLANNSDDSPVKARVLHSFSPAAPVAGAWRAARREFEWPARATEHGGNEEFHVLGGRGGPCKDNNSGSETCGGNSSVLTAVGTLVPGSCDSSPPQSPCCEVYRAVNFRPGLPGSRQACDGRANFRQGALPSSLSRSLSRSRQKLRIGEQVGCGLADIAGASTGNHHGNNSGSAEGPRSTVLVYSQDDDRGADGGDEDDVDFQEGAKSSFAPVSGDIHVGNPIMSKAKFDKAVPHALQGGERYAYIEAHPELKRVPVEYTLYIIARLQKTRAHYSYWLQVTSRVNQTLNPKP